MQNFDDIKDPLFDIPDGYFENMQMQVSQKIHHRESIRSRGTIVRRMYYAIGSIAALFVVYLGISHFQNTTEDSFPTNIESIEISSADELRAYIIQIQDGYSLPVLTDSAYAESKAVEEDIYMVSEEYAESEDTDSMTYVMENYNIMGLVSL